MDSKCNSSVQEAIHPLACDAAVAVQLASTTGRQEDAETFLGQHENDLTPELITQLVNELNLADSWNGSYEQAVSKLSDGLHEGAAAGVVRTPTYYVNGIMALGDVTDILAVVKSQMRR